MTQFRFKKIYFLFSSLVIFLLHLPVGFAKNRTKIVYEAATPVVIAPAINMLKLYDSLRLGVMGLSKDAFNCAVQGLHFLSRSGKIANDKILSIADFSLPSYKKRLFVIDLDKMKVLYNTYVAHGMNSGKEFATQFSNAPESNKTSLGFYETEKTYTGKNGYSLHLTGLEKGINDNAYKRDIVMHGANYVSEEYVQMQGYIGRSQGCPAVPEKVSKPVIDKIKNGTCFFIYSFNKNYIFSSPVLKQARA